MQTRSRPLISFFRASVLAAITAFLITSAALPLAAQNSVPPSAFQAARMPEFAKRLAHPATPQMPAKSPGSAPSDRGRHLPQGNGIAYDNGPVNGQVDAWTINFGFTVSDTIEVNSAVTGIQFWAWLEPGDTITSVEVQIGDSGYFSNDLFDGTVSLTQSSCFTNNFGFDVCLVSGNFTGPSLSGDEWVTLANANTVDGNPVYWDENSGVGCESPGCPSLAQENTIGTIPSEAFTMLGNNNGPPVCFRSQGNLQIISSFTQQQAGTIGPSGVTIDKAGNLYGTTYNGGDNGAGFAFKLARFAGWLLDPLFNFSGGNNGDQPSGVIVGPNGSLYGGAQGGIQNCGSDGSQYCGLVFKLTPQPTACRTALCPWTENVTYRFSSNNDGTGGGVSAYDQQGNLYGVTNSGGPYDAGTVFELTPFGGGWTKTTLYSFTGGNDGGAPTQVLVGNDGNLYGVAGGGVYGEGVVFQLTPSGGQWTESVLHAFTGNGSDGSDPGYLVQDSAGNVYGIVSYPLTDFETSAIFVLEKSFGWALSENVVEHSCSPLPAHFENLNNLAIDVAGKLYGTGGGFEMYRGGGRNKSPGELQCSYNYIFKASHDSNGWHYEDLEYWNNVNFGAGGSLALDTSGSLYGTTSDCGTNNSGTVWQLSP